MAALSELWSSFAFCVADNRDIVLLNGANKRLLDLIRNLEMRDSDVLISSYPKSGTNWMKAIVSCLIDGGRITDVKYMHHYVPMLERIFRPKSGVSVYRTSEQPRRMAFSHLPHDMAPRQVTEEGKGKIICVARNPKDVLVSGYYFWISHKIDEGKSCFLGTFEDYFDMYVFRPEELICGDWLDHVHRWWSVKDEPNVLMVFYEDLKTDGEAQLKRISRFLGCDHSDQELCEILDKTGFENQKSWGEIKLLSGSALHHFEGYYRKGAVGDWVNHFTVAQNRIFDEVYRRRMKELDDPIPFKFEI